jgi:hypothetical protein
MLACESLNSKNHAALVDDFAIEVTFFARGFNYELAGIVEKQLQNG